MAIAAHSKTRDARPRRSVLYLPGSNARAIEKARTLPCDVVVLDLEDSVAPETKIAARALACEAARLGGFGLRELVVRVNGLDTPWGADDLAAAAEVAPDAVLVPKASSSVDLVAYRKVLGPSTPIWAMIETCQAVLSLDALGRALNFNAPIEMRFGRLEIAVQSLGTGREEMHFGTPGPDP